MIENQETTAGRSVVGRVVSNKMDKTIVVVVDRKVKHPLYGKYLKRESRMYAHDVSNTCRIGDVVRIRSCRPMSKTKHWELVEVITQAEKDSLE